MTNSLTGDFQAVLQVSGSTVNRLLASMHQNPGPPTSPAGVPRLPSAVFIRIGDDKPINGVRGTARAQISPLHAELIDGSDDRVGFHAWLRIWYVADPGTTALPEFIYGVVRAQYGLQVSMVPQSPQMPRGGAYGFLGVIPGSVSFESMSGDHSSDAEIAAQLEPLLDWHYRPKPEPMLDDFMHRRFRSLVTGGEEAIAHPLKLGGQGLKGSIDSVRRVFLSGSDFAVAVSREYILSLLEPSLQAVRAWSTTFDVTVRLGFKHFGYSATATYTVTITEATAAWSPAAITLQVSGGAQSDGTWWAPAHVDFSVTQALGLSFDAATESLTVTQSGAPVVSVNVSGVFGGAVRSDAETTVTNLFNAQLATALAAIKPQLNALTAQKQKLVAQLQTLDDKANATLLAADFTNDGLVLRGSVAVSPRALPQLWFRKLADQSGYTAFFTSVPGGRVIDYHWKWEFDYYPSPPPGNTQREDRFLLENVQGLPGLPPTAPPGPAIPGTLCLGITAAQVNPVTGAEDTFDSFAIFGRMYCTHVTP